MSEEFEYRYSAKEQEELNAIRAKYQPSEETKMDRLRRLDAAASRPGLIISLALGLAGTLVLGSGMSMVFVGGQEYLLPGIITGLVGLVGVCAAYPVHKKITAIQRAKIAPEILRLTEEIQRGER